MMARRHPLTPKPESAPAFEAVAERIARRAILGAMARVGLVAAATACAAGLAATAAGLPVLAACAVAAIAAGCIAAWRVATGQARLFGAAIARPFDLIVAHLVRSGQDVTGQLQSPRLGRLDLAALAADESLLRERFTLVEARARETIAELAETREQANLQNLAKSQFLAGMSHELRTPLNAVLGYAMLLHEDATASGNAAAVADLERITHAGRQLLSLINDILDLSKLDTGKVTIERSVIDIQALVCAVVGEFEDDVRRQGTSLAARMSDGMGIMIGDAAKTRQCVANLMRFGCRACAGAELLLDVDFEEQAGVATNVIFRLMSPGLDGDAARFETLFDPAAGAGVPASRPFDASALGLPITRRLARLMGGDLAFERRDGQTPALKLVLPTNRGAKPGADAVRAAAEPINQPRPAGSDRKTALVIDDNAAAIDLMRRWLGKLDYDVVAAADGEQGLSIAKSIRPDLIILDVIMPGQSGYDVLEALRSNADTANTPVILVTVDDDRAKGLDAGATEYIRKPVFESQLRSMLEIYRRPSEGDILIIEDDDDSAELVSRCAEQIGFATRRAANGIEGVAMAHAIRPSAIVLDLTLPGCDGLNVIELLKADASLASVPVIVLSAREIGISDHRRIEQAGYRFMSKGLHSPREIAAQLRELVA